MRLDKLSVAEKQLNKTQVISLSRCAVAPLACNDLRLGDGGVSQRLEREQMMMLPTRCQPRTHPRWRQTAR